MNRNSKLTERKLARALRPGAEWRVLPAAFLATLLALPVNAAVTIPSDPLASGVRVAPNILFILDDSGSMAWENINNGSITSITGSGGFSDNAGMNGVDSGYSSDLTDDTGNDKMYEQNYITNTLYYNPGVDYEPWMDATGNRLSGGTGYTTAYSSTTDVTYDGVETDTSGGTEDLSDSTRTFYTPKSTAGTDTASLSNIANYYRYQIPSGGADVVRAEYGVIVAPSTNVAVTPSSGTVSGTGSNTHNLASVPASVRLSIRISSSSRTTLYKVYSPTNVLVCDSSVDEGDTDTCTVNSTDLGVYRVVTSRFENRTNTATYSLTASYRTTNSCDGSYSDGSYGWINCTSNRPDIPNSNGSGTIQRSVDDEKINFATWYSYYRTRTKAAKGGAAEAFNSMGNKVRVGYRTIHNRSNFDIPVNDGNDGRFVNNDGTNGNPVTTSRSMWFNRLFDATASSGTPLQKALNDAGLYYSNKDSSGNTLAATASPYGPEASQLSCRQNFTILTTDGYWNSSVVTTGTSGDDNNGSVITNGPAVADGGVATTDSNYKSYQYKKPAPYPDSVGNTLADVAMKYWKTDLRPDLANNVPSDYSKVAGENDKHTRDPAFWQHMVTFTISIGLKTTSGKSSVSEVDTSTTWPSSSQLDTSNPGNDTNYRLDDLLHAAVNGRGTFVSASSPQAFADGLEAALAKINERTAAFSNAGASDSTALNSGTLIFTASYVSGRWTGLLRAEKAVDGSEVWNTSTTSGVFPASYSTRNVITRGGTLTGGVGAGGTGGGATFPTSQQETALTRTGGPANYAVTGANNALYIKGDTTNAGTAPGKLRPRSTLMGDVVNSSPAYVAETDTVYIGANDGMLHAFRADTGVELFAYIPGIINFGMLADVSRGDYEHRWFVDGPIAVSPRALSPDGTKNILVGTLGRGGKGVYALDVTTPGSFGTDNVKWELSSTNATPANDNMGMVLGAPVLAKVRNGGTTLTSAVVMGNGINSGSDKAVLLVLNMDDGSVIREIPTDSTIGNGLFAPTGIYAADGKTLVYVYAGDLQGNVWKFDLTSKTPASWSSKKIFHAEKTAGTPQPITGGIASAVNTRTNQRWVFFGTGSYLTAADGNDTGTEKQSIYGVIDDIATGGSAYTRSNLTQRTVTAGTGADVGERYFQDLTTLTTTGNKGWYVDLPDKGERIVQNAQVDGSYLVTASMMSSGDSCADASGSGYINAMTLFPGMQANGKSYFDRNNDGSTDDAGTNGKPTGSVKTSGMPTLPLLLPGQLRYQTSAGAGAGGGSGGGKENKARPQWNRVSWRELRND